MSFRRTRSGQTDQSTQATAEPAQASTQPAKGRRQREESGGNMLPRRGGRRFAIERAVVRLVATGGIIGIGVLLGAILASNKVQGWITGLVIAIVSVVLAALLWSSRQL